MTFQVTASPDELLNQASSTATRYFKEAVAVIDNQFGDGYARAHADLVAAFMRTASIDFATAIFSHAVQEAVQAVQQSQDENL